MRVLFRSKDRPDSDLDGAIVAESDRLDQVVHSTREALVAPAEELGFDPRVVGLSPDDVDRLARDHDPWWTGISADAMVLAGAPPDELAAKVRRRSAAA